MQIFFKKTSQLPGRTSKKQNSGIKKTIPAIWQVMHIEGRVSEAVWLRIPLSWSGAALDSAQASPLCQYSPGVSFLPIFPTLPILSDFSHVKVIVLENYFPAWLYNWCIICLRVCVYIYIISVCVCFSEALCKTDNLEYNESLLFWGSSAGFLYQITR